MTEDQPKPLQVFQLFQEYRVYLTPDFWLITYRDADLVKVFRNTQHKQGFLLLTVEVLFELLRGKRTALREKWALWEQGYEEDSQRLGLECRAADRRVIEVDWVRAMTPKILRKE
jgi:hypothetical protein